MRKGVSKDKQGRVLVSVNLPSLPFEVFTRIVSSIYTGEIDLEMEDMESILEALDYFSLSKLAVAHVLKRKYTPVRLHVCLRFDLFFFLCVIWR